MFRSANDVVGSEAWPGVFQVLASSGMAQTLEP